MVVVGLAGFYRERLLAELAQHFLDRPPRLRRADPPTDPLSGKTRCPGDDEYPPRISLQPDDRLDGDGPESVRVGLQRQGSEGGDQAGADLDVREDAVKNIPERTELHG